MNNKQRECLVVIPARGGSKGVPRKNILDVGGLPLLAHAILAARGAQAVTRVVVSTDDPEISAVAGRFGAQVVTRPPEISGDRATSESAVVHVLESLDRAEQYRPSLVMLMQCTSPLTTAEDLDGLVAALDAAEADSAFLAVPFFHFLWQRDDQGLAQGINHEGKKRKRRQDLAPQYLESGAAYVMKAPLFLQTNERFCGKVVLHAVDDERCLEIDCPVDVAKAEAALRHFAEADLARKLPSPVAALVLDFDGVLTDNAVWVDQSGVESVRCDRGDGMGLAQLKERGIKVLILSKEQNPVVAARARKLRTECLQGIDDKVSEMTRWAEGHAVSFDQLVYAGNDINDLGCMHLAGCAVAPADAHASAKAAAQVVLRSSGGHGAVRELCDLILAAEGDR